MITSIFEVVSLLLKLFGLWESFLNFSDKKRIADAEVNRQEREEAVDKQRDAKDEAEFDKEQDAIIAHKPKP